MKKLFALPLFLIFIASTAHATVIHNEWWDGDLNMDSEGNHLILVEGSNKVKGKVGDPDKEDHFSFTIHQGQQLTAIYLEHYDPTWPNTSTGFNLYPGLDSDSGASTLGNMAMTTGHIGLDLLSVMGIGPLGPGDYSVEIREYTTAWNKYKLELWLDHGQPVPEPSAALCFGAGALILSRRLRNKRRA